MTDQTALTHAAFESLSYEDGILTWGGRKLTEIVEDAGQTPLYVYDRARMSKRVAELRAVLPAELQIHYAIKANPMPAVVRHMAGIVDGLDVASAGELGVALETRIEPDKISFAGPGKRDAELREAIDAGITISMESEGEMRRLARLADDSGKTPNVAIRVNPEFELKSSGMKMGGRPSPFGIDAERVPAMLGELRSLGLNFLGFHVYSGSQNLRIEAIVESMAKTVALIVKLADSAPGDIRFVNLGGGLGIPYFPNERPVELEGLRGPAQSAVERLRETLGDAEVILELGRFLVGESGVYVCRVVDMKTSRGLRYAICDGGLHHHLAASGNFGQVLRKNYPVAAVEKTQRMEETSIVGPLCTPLDILGDRVSISSLEVGSLVAVLQSGAYGRTASPESFLSHPSPGEIVV